MQTITPFLWFDDNAEEAVTFYVSVFPDSRILSMDRVPGGQVTVATFELCGRRFMALNGGPQFHFTEAISLFVNVDSQAELDVLWEKLISGGGQPSQCGWLKDRFGLSWQVVPTVLFQLMGGKDPEKSRRVMQALLAMSKIDIRALQEA